MDNSLSNQQLLVLKVMRLAKPKLSSQSSGFCLDPSDPSGFSQLIDNNVQKERIGEESTDLIMGQYLLAPIAFENIYLGETFTFYCQCQNEATESANDVQVKCELQTNSQRQSLPCSLQEETLAAGGVVGQVISHEVKELGQHILICSVNYKTIAGEKMYFRKFFKFPVAKPIDVKTKFYNAEDSSNFDVFLEAQIENTAAIPMVLEKVELDPSQQYSISSIAVSEADTVLEGLLNPGDVRQFLFCLTPKELYKNIHDLTTIGKLDLAWRTNMGEKGRLQTSALQRIAPGYGDIRLVVDELPATARLQQPFEIHCSVHNNSERALDLVLMLESSSSLIFCSLSGQPLGQIPPNTSAPFKLDILPVASGFQTITGINIFETNLKRNYENGDVAQIFIF